jgi:predicted phosphodiesterase
MRLGLLADIHEEVERLDRAIQCLRAQRVDRFVLLGDLYETGRRLEEMVALLEPLEAVAVWGNHDFGLCRDVTDWVRQRFSPRVRDYFATLLPSVEIDGCHFAHIEPHLDPERVEHLWSFEGQPLLGPDFVADRFPHRRSFMGHMHRWELRTPEGTVPWDGASPVLLDPRRRYLAVIHGVQQGYCAVFDTARDELLPLRTT